MGKGFCIMPIDRLVKADWNYKINNDALSEKLANNIKRNGQIENIIIRELDTGFFEVVNGNHRLDVLKSIGYSEVHCFNLGDISESQAKRIAIETNETKFDSDVKLLSDTIVSILEDFTLDEIEITMPFTNDELNKMLEMNIDEKIEELERVETINDGFEEPENIDEVKTKIKRGDIIEIGNHRLMCGDSTSKQDISILMNGNVAEMLFTSPPYSDMRDYTQESDLSVDAISNFIEAFSDFSNYQVINLGIQRKNYEIFQYWDDYIAKAKNAGYKFLSWNIWHKSGAGSIGNQTAFFPLVHEWIFVFGKKFKEINRTVERKTEITKSTTTVHRAKDGTIIQHNIGLQMNLKQMESVFYSSPELSEIRKSHPATFPVELPAEYIKAMTNDNDIVIDSFLGSGSTMVACHQLNRICYGMEISPQYCQVIVDRMIKFDENVEVKINGELFCQI